LSPALFGITDFGGRKEMSVKIDENKIDRCDQFDRQYDCLRKPLIFVALCLLAYWVYWAIFLW